MSLSFSNANLAIEILEKYENKFDITYFGKIKCLSYHSFCFFTQTQIDYLKNYFDLKENNSKITITRPHKNAQEAKNEKFYLNTYIILSSLKYQESYKKELFRTRISKRYKENKYLHWLFSDRQEIVYKNNVKYSMIELSNNFSIELRKSETEFLNKFTTYKEYKEYYSIKFKEFDGFFWNNIFYRSDDSSYIIINTKLMKVIAFIHQVFKNDFKNWMEYHDMVILVMNNHKCFFDLDFFDDVQANMNLFIKAFNTIAPNKQKNKIKKWKFFYRNLPTMNNTIKNINKTFTINWARFNDPIWAYEFYSKRLNEKTKDFLIIPKNVNYWNNKEYSVDFSKIRLNMYNVKIIQSKKELIEIGSWLHNCAGGIDKNQYYKETVSFVLYTNNYLTPDFLGSIAEGELTQLKGFKNSAPPIELFNEVLQELISNNIVDEKNTNNKDIIELYNAVCIQKYH